MLNLQFYIQKHAQHNETILTMTRSIFNLISNTIRQVAGNCYRLLFSTCTCPSPQNYRNKRIRRFIRFHLQCQLKVNGVFAPHSNRIIPVRADISVTISGHLSDLSDRTPFLLFKQTNTQASKQGRQEGSFQRNGHASRSHSTATCYPPCLCPPACLPACQRNRIVHHLPPHGSPPIHTSCVVSLTRPFAYFYDGQLLPRPRLATLLLDQ